MWVGWFGSSYIWPEKKTMNIVERQGEENEKQGRSGNNNDNNLHFTPEPTKSILQF